MDAQPAAAAASARVVTVKTGPFRENCYLVLDPVSRRGLLVDPGADAEQIAAAIAAEGAQVEHVLLTHGHFDHVGAVAELARRLAVPVHCQESEAKLIRRAPLYAIRFIKQKVEAPTGLTLFAEAADCPGTLAVRTVRTPGHTTGSVCYATAGLVFTGDTLFRSFIGPTNYPESEPERLPQSIDALLAADLPDQTVVLPGHGKPWTLGEARPWWKQNRESAQRYRIGNEMVQPKEQGK
jgi:glyoxylase-like metal-dependent hydrolase (beta-lactamase superfamily II)